MRTVIIKGSIFRAMLAANRRSIVLYDMQRHPRFDETIARVHDECLPELQAWFNEYVDLDAKQAPAGTLMWFSASRDCGKTPNMRLLEDAMRAEINAMVSVTAAVTEARLP